MPSISLIVALTLAFAAIENSAPIPIDAERIPSLVLQVITSLLAVAGLALGCGIGLATSIRRRGVPRSSSIRLHQSLANLVSIVDLAAFAWILHALEWPAVVRSLLGPDRAGFVVEEFLVILPYLLSETASWAGLYPASRRLGMTGTELGLARFLGLRARLSFGLVLPPLLLFSGLMGLVETAWGTEVSRTWWFEIGSTMLLGLAILAFAPAFVRLALPTRPLPPGPLRDRLVELGERLDFRATEILVWDTRGAVANAVVTGLFPWFRYVLLSDALVDRLEIEQIAAIHGHEIGHIRRRHFAIFGGFMIGSSGILALVFSPIAANLEALLSDIATRDQITVVLEAIALALLAGYFYFVFGSLSRLLERQADLHGARAVSLSDVSASDASDAGDSPEEPAAAEPAPRFDDAAPPCPAGIRTFTEALLRVAAINGMDVDKYSWRHGSIRQRIVFLESLSDDPTRARRFDRGVTLYTVALLSALGLALGVAAWTGALGVASGL
ncbi:MAG: M48 family metallopeptidase [Isosphaeraceae bacterium]|nr:M48 family metallopeptidase [Isosphaeraceae bacterium]